MATRGAIRDAVTAEMKAVAGTYDIEAADGTVVDTVTLDAADVSLRSPAEETLPQLVYHEDYRKRVFNGVSGNHPHAVEYDANGDVVAETRYEYVEGQFIIDVRASSEPAKEPIYEALRRQFGQYDDGFRRAEDLHEDAKNVEVHDSTTVDTGDVETAIRGDQIEVRVLFRREYTRDGEPFETLNTTLGVESSDTETTYVTE